MAMKTFSRTSQSLSRQARLEGESVSAFSATGRGAERQRSLRRRRNPIPKEAASQQRFSGRPRKTQRLRNESPSPWSAWVDAAPRSNRAITKEKENKNQNSKSLPSSAEQPLRGSGLSSTAASGDAPAEQRPLLPRDWMDLGKRIRGVEEAAARGGPFALYAELKVPSSASLPQIKAVRRCCRSFAGGSRNECMHACMHACLQLASPHGHASPAFACRE